MSEPDQAVSIISTLPPRLQAAIVREARGRKIVAAWQVPAERIEGAWRFILAFVGLLTLYMMVWIVLMLYLSKSFVASLLGVPMLLMGLAVCSYPVLNRLHARRSAYVLLPDRLMSITAFWPWVNVETLRLQRVTDAVASTMPRRTGLTIHTAVRIPGQQQLRVKRVRHFEAVQEAERLRDLILQLVRAL
jgi:hypothetical protein